MNRSLIDNVIADAIIEMNKLGIKGKETTPYLLAKIAEITKGDSLKSNIQLVYSNCRLASQICVNLNRIK